MATVAKRAQIEPTSADVKLLITGALTELRAAIKADAVKFFPNGVELISVNVEVLTVKVGFKVAGPKAAAPLGDSGAV